MISTALSRRRLLLFGGAAGLLAGTALAGWSRRSAAVTATGAVYEVAHSEEEWRRLLSPAAYRVLREHGTEPPGSSPLDAEKRAGTLRLRRLRPAALRVVDQVRQRHRLAELLRPRSPNAVGTSEDRSFFMIRTEVHCRRCGGHLGHVFDDGPPPTGPALLHERRGDDASCRPPEHAVSGVMRRALLGLAALAGRLDDAARGGGRAAGRHLRRRLLLVHGSRLREGAGRARGRLGLHRRHRGRSRPTSRSRPAAPGHAEAVEIRYDPAKVDLRPAARRVLAQRRLRSTPGGQFCDRGDQYRSGDLLRTTRSSGGWPRSRRPRSSSRSRFTADRDGDRRRPARSTRPRTTTRTITRRTRSAISSTAGTAAATSGWPSSGECPCPRPRSRRSRRSRSRAFRCLHSFGNQRAACSPNGGASAARADGSWPLQLSCGTRDDRPAQVVIPRPERDWAACFRDDRNVVDLADGTLEPEPVRDPAGTQVDHR